MARATPAAVTATASTAATAAARANSIPHIPCRQKGRRRELFLPRSGCGIFRRQDVGPFGCSPILGREWAGTRPAPTVVTADGFAARRGWATGGIDSRPATRRQRGMVLRGGVAGGTPPHKGGPKARPHRTAVVSDQWSEGTALSLIGDANWLWVGRYRRCTKVRPQSGLHPPFFCDCSHEIPMLQWPDAEQNNLILLT